MSGTITATQTKSKNLKKDLEQATSKVDLDAVLDNVKKLDNTCAFVKCKTKTNDIAIQCKYCNRRFCTSHGLPEIHGCGEAVRRDEKRKYLHPETKLSNDAHQQASTKLNMKLKQLQQERKSRQGFANKGRKK